jgi:hypothetical protein
VVREGTRFSLAREGSRQVVTWLRDGSPTPAEANDVLAALAGAGRALP